MRKIVVNAPKGGVGKTTLATNIAILLAIRGYRVYAKDLAQGGLMSKFLLENDDFNKEGNKIECEELEILPNKFEGASNYDYLVVDTDDYYKIISGFTRKDGYKNWDLIIPIVNEYNGLLRIPAEISDMMVGVTWNKIKVNSRIVINNSYNSQRDFIDVINSLEPFGLEVLLDRNIILHSNYKPPYFIYDEYFRNSLIGLLEDMGVI